MFQVEVWKSAYVSEYQREKKKHLLVMLMQLTILFFFFVRFTSFSAHIAIWTLSRIIFGSENIAMQLLKKNKMLTEKLSERKKKKSTNQIDLVHDHRWWHKFMNKIHILITFKKYVNNTYTHTHPEKSLPFSLVKFKCEYILLDDCIIILFILANFQWISYWVLGTRTGQQKKKKETFFVWCNFSSILIQIENSLRELAIAKTKHKTFQYRI